MAGAGADASGAPLPATLALHAPHLLSLTADEAWAVLALDGLVRWVEPTSHYGFYPATNAVGWGSRLVVVRDEGGWTLQWQEGPRSHTFPLPPAFDPVVPQQFRLRKVGEHLSVSWEATLIAEGSVPAGPTRLALHAHGRAAFDLVRVTSVAEEDNAG